MVKIAVTFELGAECLLTVTARELNTGRMVQAVMSAREGASAARRKLDDGSAGAPMQTGSFPAPAVTPPPSADPPTSRPELSPRVMSVLKRLFGRRGEAR
jgi:molecular chaperone DnaK